MEEQLAGWEPQYSPLNSPRWIVMVEGVRVGVKCVNVLAVDIWTHTSMLYALANADSSGAPPGVDGRRMSWMYT